MQRRRFGLWVALSVGAACACGGTSSKQPAHASAPSTEPEEPMAGATVYDADGKSKKCEAFKPSCPGAKEAPRELKDQCALKGFRIVQCGCDQFCTGNAMADRLHYDAKNSGRLCEKAKEDCEPPETSAAFQDACTAARGKFVVCGCEWLCTHKLKGPVSDKPPAEESAEQPAPEPSNTEKKPGSAAKKQ